MHGWKRWIAGLLVICMVFLMVPPKSLVNAATVDADYYYELDTDGIDVGAQYLIVSGTDTTENALYMNSGTWWSASSTQVSVSDGSIILPFTGENSCLWTFSSASNGTVYCSGYYLNIEQYTRYQSGATTLQFHHFGNGEYGIYLHGGSSTNLQYLRYGRQYTMGSEKWYTDYTYGKTGTDSSAYDSFVYLYKRVENQGVSIVFDSNGATEGTVPEGATGLENGSTYTLPAPSEDLRKDVGDDTYLFRGWNTAADGSGTQYAVGDSVTLNADLTLYADWYLQTKYKITVITDLDGEHTDVTEIHGADATVYVQSDAEGSEPVLLTRVEEGVYVTYVTENGTYYVYEQCGEEDPESAHGHKVVIYNQDGTTELLNYSVTYDAAGGEWAEGEAPAVEVYHARTAVTATEKVPSREGYVFRGWQDQNGNIIASGASVTEELLEKTTLTAVWEALITVTVNVTVNHATASGGADDSEEKANVSFNLLMEQNEVDLPIEQITLTGGITENDVTTYTYIFENMPQGIYEAAAAKSQYEPVVTREGEAHEDQTIHIVLNYNPNSFELVYNVNVEKVDGLMPQAVNVRISYWDGTQWQYITEHAADNAPDTIFIDEDGKGTGAFTVWTYETDPAEPYYYRADITSFVMPDGAVVAAADAGVYTASVTVSGDGVYYDSATEATNGAVEIAVAVTPFTVTFDAGEGTLNGEKTVVLESQYAYPDLTEYIPVADDDHHRFTGWFVDGVAAENKAGSYLTGNVTYVAQYSPHVAVKGEVFIAGTYEQDGELVTIKDIDRLQEVLVLLQKNINGVWNDVDSLLIPITYVVDEKGDYGFGTYAFEHLPNDGTVFRVQILSHNYTSVYNNNGDDQGSDAESEAVVGADNTGVVDVYMFMTPELYSQWVKVDAEKIAEGFRPESALVQYLHRDIEGVRPYAVIAQHMNGNGVTVTLDGEGTASYSVWKGNINGAMSEYQASLYKLYGTVEGVYTQEGTLFTGDSPITVEYGASSYWSEAKGQEAAMLQVTLVPREYEIIFDLNCDDAVDGIESFHVDRGTSNDHYGYVHTWSFADSFSAFPSRQGYVFDGWTTTQEGVSITNHGDVYVAPTVAETVTLTANWTKLSGTDYTVRHLELNTDKVLSGAQAVSGAAVGNNVSAADAALAVSGYHYVGAMVNGTYYEKAEEPVLTVTDSAEDNLLVIYYLSDSFVGSGQENLTLNKNTLLEDNGTYTITLDTYTKNSPIITLIERDTPLDIALVLDQSGSIIQSGYLDELQQAVNNFIDLIADHGRSHEVDHRIAIMGYAGDYDEAPTSTDTNEYPIAGGNTTNWVNTGVFDSNGDFHPYPVTGFNYTAYSGSMDAAGIYYTYSDGEYLLLNYHTEYRHLITEEEARLAALNGETVYGYVYDEDGVGSFVELSRNTSGLWLYGDKQLYSLPEFFTYHEDVWTHRKGMERRQIHAYGIGSNYRSVDGHEGIFTREETTASGPQLSVYKDALVPVSVGANGSGGINPGLTKSTSHLGSNGGTYVQYGIEMANEVFEANPLPDGEGRVRVMILFTDGMPGIGTFDETVANEAISEAYITKNTHGAHTYAIGLYPSQSVDSVSDQGFFMNAVSSNYPNAQSMDDVRLEASYVQAADGSTLNVNGPYYVRYNNSYYPLSWTSRWVSSGWGQGSYRYSWGFTRNNRTTYISSTEAAVVTNGQVGGYSIYKYQPAGYKPTENSGYYATTDSEQELKDYFELVMHEITEKITSNVLLHEDTILRDIMGQGLALIPGTVITAYKVPGVYDAESDTVTWNEDGSEQLAQVTVPEDPAGTLYSPETTTLSYTLEDGTEVLKENVPYISVYNLDAENATDPDGENYYPHTVDVTGYDFEEWYVSADHPNGYKMVVTITIIEAQDNVIWGRATSTNNSQSGLWLPEDENGDRELLVAFEEPSTIFVERAYVLDYGKAFKLSGWYFDDEDGKEANAIHLDCNIDDGMNFFDPAAPNTSNAKDSQYGNTQYGNVAITDGEVTYTPVTTQWGGYDQFYVFGNTWRKTVLSQDANENGNLWNKVTVIPANNIYYEDSFITTESESANGISGFTFSGDWELVSSDENAGENAENPEHQEGLPYGDVHGWTNDLADDSKYSDGSAHATATPGATAEFTFTGTGVDVYTRTNAASGMVVAVLTKASTGETVESVAMDNLAASGDYYQVPTISFRGKPYGTYHVKLIATSAILDGEMRYEYCIDGIRVFDPLGMDTGYADTTVRDAYGKELNAIFTELRDILLDSGSFTADTDRNGAVFIDWIREEQGVGNDQVGIAQPTYELGTFDAYGPKNEVYLSGGQAVVLKLDTASGNNYFVGLKSLTGETVEAAISGIDAAEPQVISISHTTDMYYAVTPVDGYVVIKNNGSAILSITDLRTTNLTGTSGSGVLTISEAEAVEQVLMFSEAVDNREVIAPPAEREELANGNHTDADNSSTFAEALFAAVRAWL